MSYTFKDSDGNKISLNVKASSGMKKCQKALDKKKDMEKNWWQMKEDAVSEGKIGCVEDITKAVSSLSSETKAAISKAKSAAMCSGNEYFDPTPITSALSQLAAVLEKQNEVFGQIALYLNISKPNTMYFQSSDTTTSSSSSNDEDEEEEEDTGTDE